MRGSRRGAPSPPCPQATTPFPVQSHAGQPRARLRTQTLDLPDERRWRGAQGDGGGCMVHPALLSAVGQVGACGRNPLSLSSPWPQKDVRCRPSSCLLQPQQISLGAARGHG